MLTNKELADAIHDARLAMNLTGPFDITTKTAIAQHLEALQAIQLERARATAATEMFTPVGFISRESFDRLAKGGNDSRGTVPIHAALSSTSNIEVFVRA